MLRISNEQRKNFKKYGNVSPFKLELTWWNKSIKKLMIVTIIDNKGHAVWLYSWSNLNDRNVEYRTIGARISLETTEINTWLVLSILRISQKPHKTRHQGETFRWKIASEDRIFFRLLRVSFPGCCKHSNYSCKCRLFLFLWTYEWAQLWDIFWYCSKSK